MKQLAEPDVLILGAGYSLFRVAALLGKERVVITSTSGSKVSAFRRDGWNAETFRMEEPESIKDIASRYPGIRVVIDGIAPLECQRENNVFQPAPAFLHYVQNLKSINRDLKIIYISTTGVLGVDNGDWVDECTPPHPKHERGWARLLSETIYLENFDTVTCLRLPAIYGPGRGILKALTEGRYVVIADRQRWTNRIHVEDLARCIAFAVTRDLPEVLNVSDRNPALQTDVVNYYCERFNLPMPKQSSWEEVKDRIHHTQLSNQRVSNGLLLSFIDFKLKYPSFREGAQTEQAPF